MPPDHLLSAHLLEIQRALLHVRVQLAVYKDARVEVLLRLVAEGLVLGHDALEHLGDLVEVGGGGVPVAVDFVVDVRRGGGGGDEFLEEEEVRAREVRGWGGVRKAWRGLTRRSWKRMASSRCWRCACPA